MKNVLFSVLTFLTILTFSLSPASAQLLIGAKAAGMGGAGVASVTDLSAAYYNPAGLMSSNSIAAEMKISLGAAYSDPTTLSNAISKASDPATFLLDNYASNLNFNGSLDGVIGFNIAKIGISAIPYVRANVTKPANSVGGTIEASGRYDGVLTLGTSFPLPVIGKVDVGFNAKSITDYRISIEAAANVGNPLLSSGTRYAHNGTGIGYDAGAVASVDIPMLTNVRVGYAMRDISASVKYTNKSQFYYINQSTGTVTSDAETAGADTTETIPGSTVIGASATIPMIGAQVAADVENISGGSNTHIGIEYPMLLNMLILRAGSATGPNLNLTSIGAKINLPIFSLDAAMVTNNNNSKLSQAVVDINIGF